MINFYFIIDFYIYINFSRNEYLFHWTNFVGLLYNFLISLNISNAHLFFPFSLLFTEIYNIYLLHILLHLFDFRCLFLPLCYSFLEERSSFYYFLPLMAIILNMCMCLIDMEAITFLGRRCFGVRRPGFESCLFLHVTSSMMQHNWCIVIYFPRWLQLQIFLWLF